MRVRVHVFSDAEINAARAEVLEWLANHPLFKSTYTVEQAEALAMLVAVDRLNHRCDCEPPSTE